MRCTIPILLVAVIAMTAPVRAADVSVTAEVSPSVVSVGSEAVLTVRVEGRFHSSDAPELPNLDAFDVYDSGTSQNFSYVNGQMSSSVQFRYTLVAKTEGTFQITPITFTLENKQYTADPVTIEVTAANSSVPVKPTPSGNAKSESGAGESIFITATVDMDTVYVNQQVTWTLGYYSDGRVGLLRSPNYSPPEAQGFWVEDLPPQNKYYTNIKGNRYLVNEIKRGYFPTSPGIYTIGAARVDLVLDDMRSNRSLFDDFFNRRGFGKQQTLLTDEQTVAVLPLPAAGKPAGFSGVVASDLTLAMSADKQLVQVGDPINIRMEINGTGNVRTIVPPEFPENTRYKTYESGSSSDTFKKDYVVKGRKIIDYVIIPQVEGKWQIPPVELPYFDPQKKAYRVARSLPVSVEVQPGAHEEGRKVVYAGGGDDIEVISRDIRFIHPVPSVIASVSSRIYENPIYVGAHALPLLLVLGSLIIERRRRRFRDDIGFARASRALREADRRIQAGVKLFEAGNVEDGFTELGHGFVGYFADKMNAPAAGLTSDAIATFLADRGVDDDSIASVRSVLSACDMARYASATMSAQGARETAVSARTAMREIEKRWLS